MDIFNKIINICDGIDSLQYNFVDFKTKSNIKISATDIKEYGNDEFLKRKYIN